MAEVTPPLFTDTNNVYSGDEFGLPYRDIMGEGIVEAGDLAVSQRAAGANLSVDIAAGACWIKGDADLNAQPTYRCRNNSVVNLAITPDGSNPRIVLIVAEVLDTTFDGSGSRLWRLRAVHGTPAGSPVSPALPSTAISLASIAVTAGDADIVNGQITDTRTRAIVGAGLAATPTSVPTGAMLDWGGATAPAGFLLCDGTTYSRTTYAALYAIIGFQYSPTPGSDPGSNLFYVPDSRGRIHVGLGTHADHDARGENDGITTVANRRARHKHTVVQPTISQPGVNISDPTHAHNIGWSNTDAAGQQPTYVDGISDNYQGNGTVTEPAGTGITAALASAPVASNGTVGPQTGAEPTDSPAYLTVQRIIKT
jgi:microcystin-dependent protein